jgi:tetratricopeptide (TPR) repeat protein
MKTFIVTLVIICVVATAGTILYLNCHKTPPTPVPVAESSPKQAEQTQVETIAAPSQEQPRTISDKANEPTPVPVTNSASDDLKPTTASTPHSKAVDTLVSTQTSFNDRWKLLRQLKKAGELDAAIAELQQRAADNPNDVETQNALGEALMSKFPIQDYNQSAMLGLQINQAFDAALKLDPANWEAQYSKADALSGWPPQMNTGPEVIQQLSSLIDQQETMTPQPQFANTYALLGDEYLKLGQTDKAQATWQLGLTKFPGDPRLQKRIANP